MDWSIDRLTDTSIYELSAEGGICWLDWRICQSVYWGTIIQFIHWCICKSIKFRNLTIPKAWNLPITLSIDWRICKSTKCRIQSVDCRICQSINCRIWQFVERRIWRSLDWEIYQSIDCRLSIMDWQVLHSTVDRFFNLWIVHWQISHSTDWQIPQSSDWQILQSMGCVLGRFCTLQIRFQWLPECN